MTDWLQRHGGSHSLQLAGVAVISGVAVASSIFGYQSVKRRDAIDRLKASIPPSAADTTRELTSLGTPSPYQPSKEDEQSTRLAERAQKGDYDDELILEQLARNRVFLGDEGLAKLRSSFIVIVGCGGVGSHAATALARSGVSRLRLIDFDQVSLSSLNRHAVATLSDVGTPKVHCLRRRLQQITPWVAFDARDELFAAADADKLLGTWKWANDESSGRQPDFVLDCIDNVDSKVALLHYCHSRGLNVISSMGAGCKADPTRIMIGDISLSTYDPLSRDTRRRLKLHGVHQGIPVAFSNEGPAPGKATLLPLPEEEFQKGKVDELSVLPDFRVRILPVLGTMPAMFGYTLSNHAICSIAGYPVDYNTGGKYREKMYEGIYGALRGQEERLVRVTSGSIPIGLRLPVTTEDVAYLVEEVWRGRSAVSGCPTRLVLVRWEKPSDGHFVDPVLTKEGQLLARFNMEDLVCMTKEEAAKHEKAILLGDKSVTDLYDATVIDTVQRRRREEQKYSKYR